MVAAEEMMDAPVVIGVVVRLFDKSAAVSQRL
jgi:hypothetical protein